ncbi:hypothetical protein DFAR_950003 [Desulfarculales bacterium]
MSCLIAHAEFYLSEGLAAYLQALRQALLKRGLSRKLYLDNGPAFRSHHLEEITASLGIALFHSHPTCPRAGARSKGSSAPSGPSFSPASSAIPFETSMRP